jgi:4-alpha-glucanotransferase
LGVARRYLPAVRAALRAVGVDTLVLAIHDGAFPADAADDTGRGTPCSPAGERFLRFARDLGFDAIQLGPAGATTEVNPSPYDGTLFARSPLSISLGRLAADPRWGGLLPPEQLARQVEATPPGAARRVPHLWVQRAHRAALRVAYGRWVQPGAAAEDALAPLRARFELFRRAQSAWLERAALHAVLTAEHGGRSWREWPSLDQRLWEPGPVAAARREQLSARETRALEQYRFEQFVAHEQHAALREQAQALGLRLYGDLQIGPSEQDEWAYGELFLSDYRLGCPPSRTNPEGQAWNYAVLDPALYGTPDRAGAALRWLAARLDKLFGEYDALRIDHPHGLVDPWVYRHDPLDPLAAVRRGARLFSSPAEPDHPELAHFAIATAAQVGGGRSTPRHADGWVGALTPEQVERYAVSFDVLVGCARANGRSVEQLACEVLSTLPFPVECVLRRHALGRFRVTQKADPDDPRDVYRSENARPEDWILVGSHDTEPIWALVERWHGSAEADRRSRRLAERLAADPPQRDTLARRLEQDPRELAGAHFAELFASPARHVQVCFTDLFGMREPYNRPGTVDPLNWSLRVPVDYEREYRAALARGAALNLPQALAAALEARPRAEGAAELLASLQALARALRGGQAAWQ